MLQPDTDLEQYQFSVPNLNDKVEELLAIERAHQEKLQAEERQRQLEEQQRLEAERLEAGRKETERLEVERLEQERLEQERLAQERLEAEKLEVQRLEQEQKRAEQQEQALLKNEQIEQERLEREQAERDRQAQDEAAIAILEQERAIAKQANLAKQTNFANQSNLAQQAIQSSTSSITFATEDEQASNVTIERHSNEMVYAIDNNAPPLANAESISDEQVETANAQTVSLATTPNLEKIKQDIVKQLQGYIDNYLLESMTFMNDDLNKWLKTEVEKQLNDRLSQSH